MLKQLRKKLAERSEAMKALKEKVFGENATPTKEDTAALEKALDEIDEINASIDLTVRAEKAEAEAARSAHDGDDTNGRLPAQVKKPTTPQAKLGVVIQGMVRGYKEYGLRGKSGLIKGLEDLSMAGILEDVMQGRSLNSSSQVAGGFMLAETFNEEIIPLLYPRSSFMAGNPQSISMPTGSYRQAAGASSATAGYTAEGDDIGVSQPTFKDINMTAHKLAGIVPITNELLTYSMGRAEQFVKNDLGGVMSQKADTAFYLGTGLGDSPTGILLSPGFSTAATNSTTPTQAQVDADARKLRAVFVRYPLLQNGLAWRMSPRTWQYLADMTDGLGNYIYPSLNSDRPTWKGLPVEIAGTFPENLGGGTNETYLALIAFGETLYGETRSLEMAISDEASIKVGSNMVSMFSTDQTAIRVITSHDVATRYVEVVATLTAVKWGA